MGKESFDDERLLPHRLHTQIMQTNRLFIVGFFSLACTLAADTNAPVTRPVTLKECVDLALRHNLDIQSARSTPEIALFDLRSSYGTYYDPILTLTARHDKSSSPSIFNPKTILDTVPYQLDTDLVSGSLTGHLPFGTVYGFSVDSSYNAVRTAFPSNSINFLLFPPAGIRNTNNFVANVAITLQQPLLRDFWIDAARLKIQISRKNLKISEQALRAQMIDSITFVQLAYYDLVHAREQVKVYRDVINLESNLLTGIRKRVQAGDLAPLSEKLFESQLESTRANLIGAEQTYAQQQNILNNLISDDLTTGPQNNPVPTEILVAVPVKLNRAESLQRAMQLRPDLQQARIDLEKKDAVVSYANNQLYPSLNLIGSYGGIGVAQDRGSASDQALSINNPVYFYGAVLSLPLSFTAERNNYKSSKAAKNQAALHRLKLEQTVWVQVDNAMKAADGNLQRVESTRLARAYAETALEVEQKKLEGGRSDAFLLIELQRQLVLSRSAENQVRTDYNKALINLEHSEGSTLEKFGIVIDLQ